MKYGFYMCFNGLDIFAESDKKNVTDRLAKDVIARLNRECKTNFAESESNVKFVKFRLSRATFERKEYGEGHGLASGRTSYDIRTDSGAYYGAFEDEGRLRMI